MARPRNADGQRTRQAILDAALDQPLADVVATLKLPGELEEALVDRRGPLGPAMAAVLAYENTDWPAVREACRAAGLPEVKALSSYRQALEWAETVLQDPAGS